jgi:peptidoglycan/LPS O-acetylase OafA/YrhL
VSPTRTPARAGYLPGLDGLRAISVVAVLLYHAGVRSMPGGFLGVEVFFVISGYLITLLLTREYSGASTISVRGFWGRRARRLLPALYVLLAVTAIGFVAFYR